MSQMVAPANLTLQTREYPKRQYRGRATDLKSRIRMLMTALACEAWLPMGLRSLVAEEGANMYRLLETRDDNLETVASKAHVIAFLLHAHGDRVRNSNTAAQLRILDLELCSHRDAAQNGIGIARDLVA